MTVQHSDIQDSECHEPKNFTGAATGDAGKVNTPSGTTAGISVLRKLDALEINYDNTASGLSASDVKNAIDEVGTDSANAATAAGTSYDNSGSGLSATDVKAALDELDGNDYTQQSAIANISLAVVGETQNAGSADKADVDSRLNTIETKVNSIISALESAGILSS